MKFTTPCFVRVEDAEKRDKLLAWCKDLGYTTSGFRFSMPQPVCYLFTGSDFAGRCGELAIGSLPGGAIDCGTDIELFKALAAMNDENDREQWFRCHRGSGEDFYIGHLFHYDEVCCLCSEIEQRIYFHKATAEEIIKYFKKDEKRKSKSIDLREYREY